MKIMQSNSKKAAVALSGGLDSSVTCFLLKKQGYEVAGITAKMVDDENFEQVVQNARKVAEKLEEEEGEYEKLQVQLEYSKRFKEFPFVSMMMDGTYKEKINSGVFEYIETLFWESAKTESGMYIDNEG